MFERRQFDRFLEGVLANRLACAADVSLSATPIRRTVHRSPQSFRRSGGFHRRLGFQGLSRRSVGPECEPPASPHYGQHCSANNPRRRVSQRGHLNRNHEIDSRRLRWRIEFRGGWSHAQLPAPDRGSAVRPGSQKTDRFLIPFHAGAEEFRKSHEWLKYALRPTCKSARSTYL